MNFRTLCFVLLLVFENGLTSALGRAADISIDSGWKFFRGDAPGADAISYPDSTWQSVDLPHDWSITEPVRPEGDPSPFDSGAPNGSDVGYARGGFGWYRRVLNERDIPQGEKTELILQGAQQECDVWVNGAHVLFQPHGYIPAHVDISPYLRARDQVNVIALRVWNPERNSRWYSGSGLYRGVSLRGHAATHVSTWGARVDTVWLKENEASIQLRVRAENGNSSDRFVSLEVEIQSPDGVVTQHELGDLHLQAETAEWSSSWLWLKNVKPWTLENPKLYRAILRVKERGTVIDEYALRFGIRTVEIDAEHGLRLNGQIVKLKGGNLHHDNGLLGAAAFEEADRRRVRLLKESGFNAIRTAHNPPSSAFLDACDEVGMLVIEEFADSWQLPKMMNGYQRYFDEHSGNDLRAMISRDFNHPSIVMWSIGNEIPERFTPSGVAVGRRLADVVHREDPRRFVTASVNLVWEDPSRGDVWELNDPAFSVLDVGGYNYRWMKFENDHSRFPQRVMYTAESYPLEAKENWDQVEKHPYVVGDFVWSAIDYLGESGLGHASYVDLSTPEENGQDASHLPWPVRISNCGDRDILGDRKPQSYYRDVVWRRSDLELLVHEPIPENKKEKVGSWGWPAEFPSWNWPTSRGKPLRVTVYTHSKSVRLTLNGRTLGTQTVENLRAVFEVPWEPGTLKAEALDGETLVSTKMLSTTGPARQIAAAAESGEMQASRASLVFIPVSICDDRGNVVPDAQVPIEVDVDGDAEVIGFGSGNPAQASAVRLKTTTTFRGRALLILRSLGKAGTVHYRIRGGELTPGSGSLLVRETPRN